MTRGNGEAGGAGLPLTWVCSVGGTEEQTYTFFKCYVQEVGLALRLWALRLRAKGTAFMGNG